ncbi:MAG: hypothetical protein AAGC60_25715 [Acidobacteriota bacterium]
MAQPAAAAALESEPPVSPANAAASADELSIRIARPTRRSRCALCRRRVVAAGPIGHAGSRPVCDRCLLDHDPQLGMAMAMISVARAYGSSRPHSLPDEERARAELLAFARLYDQFVARFGPARPPLEDWGLDEWDFEEWDLEG